jgi:type I restriction enzyme S subunit
MKTDAAAPSPLTLHIFLEKFDLFADAPDAVATMRELVLHLAVHGNLVSQSTADEPATELLKRSRVEMAKRMAARQAKQEKPAAPVSDEEVTFSLPAGWEWCRLVDAGQFINGLAFKPSDWGSIGRPIIRIQNLSGRSPDFNRTTGTFDSSVLVRDGDILVSWSATLDAFIWRGEEGVLNQHIFRVLPAPLADKGYLYWLLKWVIRQLAESDHAHGLVMSHINRGPFLAHPIPLPPLAEQKRIVAKVDELMALCDRMEAQQQDREARHAVLARSSLARFADAPTPANLPFLFHPSYAIPPADLRKSILTLAVQGKLVPQDPNDEPAEELIARIATMRHLKKAKQYEPVSADEVTYQVPFSWAWVRLGNISLTSDSGWSPQCLPEARSGTDWGVLKVSAVSWGVFKPEENKALPPGMTTRPDCEVKAGDFLLSRANTEELVARSVVVDQTPPRLMMSDKIVRFTFPDEIERAFINLVNTSDPSRDYYARNASGTSSSMKNIGRNIMCKLPIPLPPIAEQRRIVAKVEQLMALVDALETQLAASRATAANLLSALVLELTAQV